MDVRNNSRALDNLLLQLLQSQKSATNKGPEATASAAAQKAQKGSALTRQDTIALSQEKPSDNKQGFTPKSTKLVSEDIQPLENGFRRLQEFETAQGRNFSRTEEVTTENDRSKRTVIQQNSSGNTTILENILDRQEDGSFRLTQRYTDETGETNINITFNVTPDNANIILGRPPAPEQDENPFKISRGTQFDVTA